jgi:hypothetical protein
VRVSRPTPSRAEAGAVNALWLIVIMIMWLATLGLLYTTSQDVATLEEAELNALQAERAMETKYDDLNDQFNALSSTVGYRDVSANAKSDVASIRLEVDAIKTLLGDAVGGADSEVALDTAVKRVLVDRQNGWTAAQNAAASFETEKSARQAADAKVLSVEDNYRTQLANVTRQLSEANQAADTQAANDQTRIDDVTESADAADAARRSAEQERDDVAEQARQDASLAAATIQSLRRQRAPIEPEKPDGEVLAVSDGGAVAWIDLGGKHGLKAGTRFELMRRGRSGELISRGKVEVRQVESDKAMVGLLEEPNIYDPMLPGDLIRNPHFSKGESLHFYLLGAFPLGLSKEFVTGRLTALGGQVDSRLGTITDVLVVGEKNLANDEDEPDLTDTEEYRYARSIGMRIIRLDELAAYLRY